MAVGPCGHRKTIKWVPERGTEDIIGSKEFQDLFSRNLKGGEKTLFFKGSIAHAGGKD